MGIHLRTLVQDGDAVEYAWYCSRSCWSDSFRQYPDRGDDPRNGMEHGGEWPGGAEHDWPDFCNECGAPIGNPLTGEGEDMVREIVARGGSHAADLRREYSYLF